MFALSATYSAFTGVSPAYVIFGHEPTLSLEYTVGTVTDGLIWSVTDYIANMEFTL